MKLVYYPAEILAREVKDVDLENLGFDPVELKIKMTEIMLANGGIGLSACQIGLDYKLFIMGDKLDNISLHINPTVIQYTEETVVDLEGCLSFPNMFVKPYW